MIFEYKNNLYIFKDNNIEKNILFLKIKEKFNFKDDYILNILNIYFNMKNLKCKYNKNTELKINNIINNI